MAVRGRPAARETIQSLPVGGEENEKEQGGEREKDRSEAGRLSSRGVEAKGSKGTPELRGETPGGRQSTGDSIKRKRRGWKSHCAGCFLPPREFVVTS